MGLRNIKNWNEFEEQITFEIWVDGIDENISTFSRFIADGATEEDFLSSNTNSTYRAFITLRKINEEDEELPEIRGTRHPSNRAERRKATEHQKRQLGAKYRFSAEPIDAYWIEEIPEEDKKVTHWLFDTHKEVDGMTTEEYYEFLKSIPWDKVKACNVKQSWGGKSLSKKIDNRKRRHQRIEEQEGAEPFNPWYDPDYIEDVDYETGLNLPVGTGYWSDETLSEAIKNHNNPYYDYDWEEILKDDEEELEELDEILDEDDDEIILVDAEEGDDELVDGLRQLNRQLELEVRKLYDFINEYNLNKLFSEWEKSH